LRQFTVGAAPAPIPAGLANPAPARTTQRYGNSGPAAGRHFKRASISALNRNSVGLMPTHRDIICDGVNDNSDNSGMCGTNSVYDVNRDWHMQRVRLKEAMATWLKPANGPQRRTISTAKSFIVLQGWWRTAA
jgi:hypothetical protein